ncbi:hypothetical protein GFB49_13655 [Epibacterium sp. SM1979]|uniref:TniQ domain-containing protein n=1 Tax=Tritonibacter litoralis TaxID=2662264 RepID=A0A843YK12_9RHOB|nr:hypothetical protein [Tritonibacter litoralis]
MTGVLYPLLPLKEQETASSWVCRLADFHTGGPLLSFLNDQALSAKDVSLGKRDNMLRLSDVTGVAFEELVSRQPEQVAKRRYRFRNEEFSTEFMVGMRTAFCAACILENDVSGSHRRVGIWPWLFASVRTCEKHTSALQYVSVKHWAGKLRNLHEVAPEGQALFQLADSARQRSCSPLQRYLLNRLEGGSGPDWMDNQSLEQACWATKMLGVLDGWGTKPDLNEFDDHDWDQAERLGYEIAQAGEQSIRDVFSDVLRRAAIRRGKAGPSGVFGFLYEKLQSKKLNRDPGPIRSVLREFILDEMVVSVGFNLLGEEVQKTRRHHAHSLAVKYKLHPKTVHRALVAQGLISSHDLDHMSGLETFDAAEGEEMARSICRAIPVSKLAKYMNATRPQVDICLKEGFLQSLAGAEMKVAQVLEGVDAEKVDCFLARLSNEARIVGVPARGLANIPQAAQEAKRYSGDILRLLLEGKLTRVEQKQGTKGYLAILVCPKEVRKLLPRDTSHLPLCKAEAAALLGVNLVALDALLGLKGGVPLLRWVKDTLPGPIKVRIENEEVERFLTTHITLGELQKRSGLHQQTMRKLLRQKCIEPLYDPKKIRVYLYDRGEALAAIQ